MKYIFSIILVLVILTSSGFARNYRILGIENFPGDNDLSNADADEFDSEMGSASATNWFTNGWKREGYYKDADVTSSKFKPSKMIDYIYFTGHGSNGYACLSDGTHWLSFDKNDFGKPSTVKHLILACCLSVDRASSWSSCFGNGLKTILGYKKVSFEWYDTKVALKFAKLINNIDVNASEKHVDAWMSANNLWFSDKLADRWTGMGYGKNDGKLYFWQQNSSGSNKDLSNAILLPPTMTLANGKIKVYLPINDILNRGKDEKIPDIKTLNEDISKLDILNNTNILKSIKFDLNEIKNSDHKTYKISSGKIDVYKTGALVYQKNITSTLSTLTIDQAIKNSFDFVAKNGGVPSDFSYNNTSKITKKNVETGKETVVGYSVSWSKNINGTPVRGGCGDNIKVLIKNNEVASYYRLCRKSTKPAIKDVLRSSSLSSIKDILVKAQKNIIREIKTSGDIKIVDIDKIYHSPEFSVENAVYRPAYRLTLEDGSELYLDARTAQILH